MLLIIEKNVYFTGIFDIDGVCIQHTNAIHKAHRLLDNIF